MTTVAPTPTAPRDAGGPLPAEVRIAVIGSGFGGLGTGVRLKQAGIHDFLLLERGDDVGGTWRDNSYPGCACDVPSHLYSFSFAPNPNWSRSFSPQPEIQAYLQDCADRFGLREHLHLNTEVTEARWHADRQRWHVRTTRGELWCQILVAAQGPLSAPSIPEIAGRQSFAGEQFHSAQWNHEYDLRGKRVAVIGTGASAIQFVPKLQPEVARLTLFQRTPAWVLGRRDRQLKEWEHKLFRSVPAAQKAARWGIYWGHEAIVIALRGNERMLKAIEGMARKNLHDQVADETLRRKLTPSFRIGCKRILQSNDYYPAISQPNVEVETDRIVEIVPSGVVTENAEGERVTHEVDAIIWGTGFHVTDIPLAQILIGKDGRKLADHWAEHGMAALHGASVAGFPNLFMLVGPNTGLGHTSIVFIIESQLKYLIGALRAMEATHSSVVEARHDIQDTYNAGIQRQLEGTVWNSGGCSSWYLDERGRNTTLWPTFTFSFRRLVRRFDAGDYLLERAHSAVPGLPSERELTTTGSVGDGA